MAYLVTDVGGKKDRLVESASPIWLSCVFAESSHRTFLKSHSSWGLYAYIKFLKTCCVFRTIDVRRTSTTMGQTNGRDIAIRRKFQLPLGALYSDFVLIPDEMQPATSEGIESLALVA